MNKLVTEKYKVKNIDCANCAAKIESSLNQTAGVDYASLDFATQMLHIQASNMENVIAQINLIEPGVVLVPHSRQTREEEHPKNSKKWFNTETITLVVAIILLVFQLFFENRIHELPIQNLEIFLALTAYIFAGWNVLLGAIRTIRRGMLFDENVLMVIATCGAFAIHAYAEAIGVMIFFKIGELLQNRAISNSRSSIHSLLAAKPKTAFVQTPTGLKEVEPEEVRTGDIIVVKPGEKIPLDGKILEGHSQLDTSALTGETTPVSANVGDDVMAGVVSGTGALTIEVSRPFYESSIAKVMDLVENATARKAKTEKFITSFARYYTPAVVLIAIGVATLPPILTGASFETWIYRALVMLVISCPCALVISIPLGYFAGIGRASKQGILVKGSNFIDALANVRRVVFDKTGTLTKGVFKVNKIVSENGYNLEQVLEFAAAAELHSSHPIARSIINECIKQGIKINESQISQHVVHSGKGVAAQYGSHAILVGNVALLRQEKIVYPTCEASTTIAHVAVDGTYIGYILVGDELKPETSEAINELRKMGVTQLVMLTGDNANLAAEVAAKLKLDSFHADLLPENKVEIFEKLINDDPIKGNTAFVGDGINDAPVLARSDVGIAMGALGSDAAIETADVVLMTDSLAKVSESIVISQRTRRIVWQNIILAFTVKGLFLVLGAIGLATMWEAVFADVGTALLAVANSSRILKG